MLPEELERAVAKGEIAPLYFLFGEEDFLLERALQRLLAKASPPDFRDFNFTIFYGKECRAEQIIDNAMTLPMFAERRVTLVKRADELNADALEQLLPYIASPSPQSCLIFQAAKIDQRRKFFAELKKADALVEFKRLKEEQLDGFVRREAMASGKKFDAEAAALLVYYCGTVLRELVAQMEKLIVYVGSRERVTAEDVKAIVSDTKVDTVFEFANALGSRDADRALRQLQILLRDADAPYMLVGAIARHFRQLCLICELQGKRASTDEISKRLKINPYFLKGMMGQAKNFRLQEFQRIFGLLHETDLGLKSGGKQGTLFEMMLFGICSR